MNHNYNKQNSAKRNFVSAPNSAFIINRQQNVVYRLNTYVQDQPDDTRRLVANNVHFDIIPQYVEHPVYGSYPMHDHEIAGSIHNVMHSYPSEITADVNNSHNPIKIDYHMPKDTFLMSPEGKLDLTPLEPVYHKVAEFMAPRIASFYPDAAALTSPHIVHLIDILRKAHKEYETGLWKKHDEMLQNGHDTSMLTVHPQEFINFAKSIPAEPTLKEHIHGILDHLNTYPNNIYHSPPQAANDLLMEDNKHYL